MRNLSINLVASMLALAGCIAGDGTDSGDLLGPRGDCNPVDESQCLLPYPSSFFLDESEDTPSGYQLSLGPHTGPVNSSGVPLNPHHWNIKDGFSTWGPLLAWFPELSTDNLISNRDIDQYLASDATTVILDPLTGQRVPHFAELEAQATDPDQQLLYLRPVQPLQHAQRYVVGIRHLQDREGNTLAAPLGFSMLRDGATTQDPDLERQREHYETDIFPVLEAAGFSRDELQLAWDFVTVSAENSLGPMLAMRDDALAWAGDSGPPYTITTSTWSSCGDDPPPDIGLTLQGTFTAPLYLTAQDAPSWLTRDSRNIPFRNGEVEVPFTIRVPCSLISDPRPGTLVQYGHGLLGDQSEVNSSTLGGMAADYGWVLFAVDWTGMNDEDVTAIIDAIVNDFSDFSMVPERSQQGFIEQLLSGRMMLGAMAQDDYLMVDGISLIDTSHLYFYGNSQGAILGGAYMALSPDISRAVLGVGGTPFSLLLTRSTNFDVFLSIFQEVYPSWTDISVLLALVQTIWDPGESAGWARYITEQPVDDTVPTKNVLLQAGIGDAQVPTLGAQNLARACTAWLVEPSARPVWGLDSSKTPFEGSAYVEVDYGVEEPEEAIPVDSDIDVHNTVRTEQPIQDQIRLFLEEGRVENFCDGSCDPD